jgi:calcineurin-like phosphoesterase family protein
MIYFTSDLHLGHKNILHLDKRPFESLEEMERGLIYRWNARVSPEDTVYNLGDFFWTFNTAKRVAPQLNGKIFCIRGNHDKAWWKPERLSAEIPNLTLCNDSIHVVNTTPIPIVLCHYPLRSWPGSARGSWHIYGHTHREIGDPGRSLCVCANLWDYSVVSLEQVEERIKDKPHEFY